MQAIAETRSTITVTLEKPVQGVLRCHWNRLSGDSRTNARIDDDVAEQGARRLGTFAILTAVSVVAAITLKTLLQPELAAAYHNPLFRLSALYSVLASVGLAVLQRSRSVHPQILLDLGLAFEITGA